MADYPALSYIPLELLLAVGDPWQADETLQSGDPGQIAELASAFQQAGGCTQETWAEWEQARARFNDSWNRENGVHPIDDSAEVHRATTQLFVQKDQLPLIAVDLQNLAADLASAESQSGSKTAVLNAKLQLLDMWVGEAMADDRDYSKHLDEAESLTSAALAEVERIRDEYTDKLEHTAFDLRLKHGYDPGAIEDVDGDGEVSAEERGRTAPEHYAVNQRAKDEALLGSAGPITPEKAAAASRLRDYAVTRDPGATAEQADLATQRLDDFRMANFVGPLPTDRVLGGDARTRAQARLEMQRQLEQGVYGLPPLSADQATQALNDGEALGRTSAIKSAYFALTSRGVSGDGALTFIDDFLGGSGPFLDGAEAYGNAVPQGQHARPTDLLSAADAKRLAEISGKIGRYGDLVQFGVALTNVFGDDPNRYEEFGKATGGIAGGTAAGWGAALVASSFTGPVGVAVIAAASAYFGGVVGEHYGGQLGSNFDPQVSRAGGS